MNFHQHLPTGILSNHIDVLMHFTNYLPNHSIERVVPTGNVFIIFELDGITRHTYDAETLAPNATFNDVWISGMHKNYLSISAHENSSMFVIQFKPTGAYPFFHIGMESITEKVVPAVEVFGNEILTLRTELFHSASTEEKFSIAEDWLNKRYKEQYTASEDIVAVVTKLQKEPAAYLNDIIASFPNTQKHLIDLFKKHTGLTPKVYQRIMRFNEILQRIQNKEQIAWTDIAYSCGYSDQSHFIKEFKHFSGFNPKEFIKQSHNNQPNFFPIDKKG